MNKLNLILSLLVIIGLTVAIGYYAYWRYEQTSGITVLKVFHAGSLVGPFEELEELLERLHPDVDVQCEPAGSVDTIRKVTELGKRADVVASADYSIIDAMMIDDGPRHADWNIRFARNQLVIAYTSHSKYKDEITESNWFEIFERDNVIYGFSNPNADPCGYRTVMMFQLAELHYNVSGLFEGLIEAHTDIALVESNGTYVAKAPEDISPDGKLMIRPKEVDLMALLEVGALDYLIIYRSVAYQHRSSGVRFVELPPQIDLSSVEYADTYDRVKLEQLSDITGHGQIVTAKPIVYGITVPSNAVHRNLALEFVELVVTADGRDILIKFGMPPLVPAVTDDTAEVPDALKTYVVEA